MEGAPLERTEEVLIVLSCGGSHAEFLAAAGPLAGSLPMAGECAEAVQELEAFSVELPETPHAWLAAVQEGVDNGLQHFRRCLEEALADCAAGGGVGVADVRYLTEFHGPALVRLARLVRSEAVSGTGCTVGSICDAFSEAGDSLLEPFHTYTSLVNVALQCALLGHMGAWVAHGMLLGPAGDATFFIQDTWEAHAGAVGGATPHAEWQQRFQIAPGALPLSLLSLRQAQLTLDLGKFTRLLTGGDTGDLIAKAAAAGGRQDQVRLSVAAQRSIGAVFTALQAACRARGVWDGTSLSVALDKVHAVLQKYLWASMVHGAHLGRHLVALRNVALLGRGELFRHFLDMAAPLLGHLEAVLGRTPASPAAARAPAACAASHKNTGALVALQGHLNAGPWAAAVLTSEAAHDPTLARVAWQLRPPRLDCVLDVALAGYGREPPPPSATTRASRAHEAALATHSRVTGCVAVQGQAAVGTGGATLPAPADVPSAVWLRWPQRVRGGFIAAVTAVVSAPEGEDEGGDEGGGVPPSGTLCLLLQGDARGTSVPLGTGRSDDLPLTDFLMVEVGPLRGGVQGGAACGRVVSGGQGRPLEHLAGLAWREEGGGQAAPSLDTPFTVQVEYSAPSATRPGALAVSLLGEGDAAPVVVGTCALDMPEHVTLTGVHGTATFGVVSDGQDQRVRVQRVFWADQGAVLSQATQCLHQQYTLPWPAHLVIPPAALTQYSNLCAFMLSGARAGHVLHAAWQHLKQVKAACGSRTLALTRQQSRGVQGAWLLLARAKHTLSTLQYHLLVDSVDALFPLLLNRTAAASSLLALNQAHADFQRQLLERTLLASSAAARCVLHVFRFILELGSWVTSLHVPAPPPRVYKGRTRRGRGRQPPPATGATPRAAEPGTLAHELGTQTGQGRLSSLSASLRREVEFLFRLELAVASRGGGGGGGRGSALHDAHAGLALRLNWNDFFTSPIAAKPILAGS